MASNSKSKKNKYHRVWVATYNPCVHESAAETISIHETEQGARDAMNKHKKNNRGTQDWESWDVERRELLP